MHHLPSVAPVSPGVTQGLPGGLAALEVPECGPLWKDASLSLWVDVTPGPGLGQTRLTGKRSSRSSSQRGARDL